MKKIVFISTVQFLGVSTLGAMEKVDINPFSLTQPSRSSMVHIERDKENAGVWEKNHEEQLRIAQSQLDTARTIMEKLKAKQEKLKVKKVEVATNFFEAEEKVIRLRHMLDEERPRAILPADTNLFEARTQGREKPYLDTIAENRQEALICEAPKQGMNGERVQTLKRKAIFVDQLRDKSNQASSKRIKGGIDASFKGAETNSSSLPSIPERKEDIQKSAPNHMHLACEGVNVPMGLTTIHSFGAGYYNNVVPHPAVITTIMLTNKIGINQRICKLRNFVMPKRGGRCRGYDQEHFINLMKMILNATPLQAIKEQLKISKKVLISQRKLLIQWGIITQEEDAAFIRQVSKRSRGRARDK